MEPLSQNVLLVMWNMKTLCFLKSVLYWENWKKVLKNDIIFKNGGICHFWDHWNI